MQNYVLYNCCALLLRTLAPRRVIPRLDEHAALLSDAEHCPSVLRLAMLANLQSRSSASMPPWNDSPVPAPCSVDPSEDAWCPAKSCSGGSRCTNAPRSMSSNESPLSHLLRQLVDMSLAGALKVVPAKRRVKHPQQYSHTGNPCAKSVPPSASTNEGRQLHRRCGRVQRRADSRPVGRRYGKCCKLAACQLHSPNFSSWAGSRKRRTMRREVTQTTKA